jgi:hypothetical protein
MFPLSVLTYVKMGLCVLLLVGAWYLGYSFEHKRFTEFQNVVREQAAQQEAKVQSITKQQALVTKGIQDEYDAKLSAIRNYYKSTSVWNNGSASKVPGLSPTSQLTDVISSYNVLAGQCAETTLQLVELQKWINEQVGIK